jgi:acetyl esterase/lipase
MTAMDLRVRMLGALARPASSISKMSRERVLKMQRHGLMHNRLTDQIFGAIAPEVALNDQTIDGPGGVLPVRVYRPQTESSALVVHFHGGGWTLR